MSTVLCPLPSTGAAATYYPPEPHPVSTATSSLPNMAAAWPTAPDDQLRMNEAPDVTGRTPGRRWRVVL